MIELVYETDGWEIHLQTPDNGEAEECWFMFSAFQTHTISGSYFLGQRPCRAVHIISKRDAWYQDCDLHEAMSAAGQLRAGLPGVAFGGSMGGFGAILCAPLIGAQTVLAGSPQTVVDIDVARSHDLRFEAQWVALAKVGLACADLTETIGWSATNICVAYDPFIAADNWHASRIKNLAGVRLLPMSSNCHNVFHPIKAVGQLNAFFDAAISGDEATISDIRRKCWQARRDNLDYLMNRGCQLRDKGREALARPFLERASLLTADHRL
jgi:hypothetical protein